MNRKGIIGIVIAIPVLIIAGFALFFLGSQNLLPGQTQPTAIPVTPFANLGSTAPAGTTVAASTATAAPAAAAATTAPVAAATTAPVAADSGYGNYSDYGNYGSGSTAPTAVITSSSSSSAGAATAPAASAAAKAPGGATTYTITGDKSQAKVTVNEKLANLPSPSDAVLTTNAIQGQLFLGPDTKPVEGAKIMVDMRTLKSDKTQRDNFIRTNTLQADQFPLAEYVITGVDGWTGPLTEGKSVHLQAARQHDDPWRHEACHLRHDGNDAGRQCHRHGDDDLQVRGFRHDPAARLHRQATDTIKLDMNIVASKAA